MFPVRPPSSDSVKPEPGERIRPRSDTRQFVRFESVGVARSDGDMRCDIGRQITAEASTRRYGRRRGRTKRRYPSLTEKFNEFPLPADDRKCLG